MTMKINIERTSLGLNMLSKLYVAHGTVFKGYS